jgi:phosphoribosylformylglycinamidine synthase subunit PurSL
VITAVAHVPDVDHCVTPDLSESGNALLLIGETGTDFAGSHLDMVLGAPKQPGVAPPPVPDAPTDYRHLHAAIRAGLVESCHDLSEGGLAVAVAEMCIGGRLGADIDALPHDDLATALFAESSGRLVVEVQPRRVAAFLKVMDGRAQRIGTVTNDSTLRFAGVEPLALAVLVDAFNGGGA